MLLIQNKVSFTLVAIVILLSLLSILKKEILILFGRGLIIPIESKNYSLFIQQDGNVFILNRKPKNDTLDSFVLGYICGTKIYCGYTPFKVLCPIFVVTFDEGIRDNHSLYRDKLVELDIKKEDLLIIVTQKYEANISGEKRERICNIYITNESFLIFQNFSLEAYEQCKILGIMRPTRLYEGGVFVFPIKKVCIK